MADPLALLLARMLLDERLATEALRRAPASLTLDAWVRAALAMAEELAPTLCSGGPVPLDVPAARHR